MNDQEIKFTPMQLVYDKPSVMVLTPDHNDDYSVLEFSNVMRDKMRRSRENGRYGWDDPSLCSSEYLAALLYSAVDRGDVVDIANFCMMLHQRGVYDLNYTPSFYDECD